jgi:4-amino-4-deoxy-L-arabinose transferase-like glycosyltransferase
MKDDSVRRVRRIQIVAKIFRFLCLVGMVVLVAAALMTIFKPDEVRGGFGDFRIEKLKPEYLWVKRPLILVLLTIPATFVWLLYRLFGLYSRGVMFGEANVRYIKALGYWMIGAWVISMPIQLLQYLQDTERLFFKFNLDGYFFGGVLVLLLAWIMEEGKKLQEEQTLTV